MPILIFLHGLLGTQHDWQAVIEKLPHFRCIALDLPLHGKARAVSVNNFDETSIYLAEKIKHEVGNAPYFLVGYSMGGRIALYYALQAQVNKGNLQGLILEGANLGLKDQAEKEARWQNDQKWARRFSDEPAEDALHDWYRQPVFAHLSETQRLALIRQRIKNCDANISQMLLATSLAKQPDFSAKVRSNILPIYYIVGEKDWKFKQIALDNQLDFTTIENAGHNAHSENPEQFAKTIKKLCFNYSVSEQQ